MFWDKKDKKEGLPDLPPMPSKEIRLPPIKPLPEIHENSNPDLPSIGSQRPSFKKLPTQEPKIGEKTKLPELPEFRGPERNERNETIMELDSKEHNLETIPSQIPNRIKNDQTERGPIFVKLNKYKSAKESLENIKEKLEEIDLLLKKTREIRTKEESELEYWEKETNALKSQLQTITEDIFEKAE